MQITGSIPGQTKYLQSMFRLLYLRLFGLVIFSGLPILPLASPLTLVVDGGGVIAADTQGKTCHSSCRINFNANSTISLFAIPDQGYRFQAWSGLCSATSGPLCSLNLARQGIVRARFTKSLVPMKPAKALLLLHGEGNKPSVWNDFVEKYFENQCPTIYGGLILDSDVANTQNDVFCYRIAFGYYQFLPNSKASMALKNRQDRPSIEIKSQINEIQAAVLGIQTRHPAAQITLISEPSTNSAAQFFIETSFGRQSRILGLLGLQSKVKLTANNSFVSSKQARAMVSSFASVHEPVKINNALIQMTESWWLRK